jgi:hypothetical protein
MEPPSVAAQTESAPIRRSVSARGGDLLRLVHDDDARHQRRERQHHRRGREHRPPRVRDARQEGGDDEHVERDAEQGREL